MCRLLIGTSRAIQAYDKRQNLQTLLVHLEKQCGGHGSGVSFHKNGTIIFTRKGVSFTAVDATKAIRRFGYGHSDFIVFHTRIASIGAISDRLCHPYTTATDSMTMNGTLSEFKGIANALNTTDTEVVFNLLKGLPLSQVLDALTSLSAVFVGSAQGKPYAVRNGGSLEEWRPNRLQDRDYLFASSFPKRTPCVKDLPYGFVFADGERRKTPVRVSEDWHDWSLFSDYESNSCVDSSDDSPFLPVTMSPDYTEGFEHGYQSGFMDGYSNSKKE